MMSTDLPATISKKPTRKNLSWILASIVVFLIIVVILVVVFIYKTEENYEDTSPQNGTNINENIITRKEWSSQKINKNIPKLKHPVQHIIICHTVGRFCESFDSCSFVLRWMQNRSLHELHQPDLPYNFLVGGDGNIYEGRGWNYQNQLRFRENSIAIAFIGNYVFYDFLTENMINATNVLLNSGVEKGLLKEHYLLVPQNHTSLTMSPGENIYKKIKTWKHFSSNIFI